MVKLVKMANFTVTVQGCGTADGIDAKLRLPVGTESAERKLEHLQ
jgi:hypothetical protein